MSDLRQNPARPSESSLEALLDASRIPGGVNEGEITEGTVKSVSPEFVIVTLGEAAEGQVPIKEFSAVNGVPQVKVGDKLDVLVEFRETLSGPILLSKTKAAALKTWDNICTASDRDGILEGVIVARVKGGLSVDVGVKAFLPGSQATLWPTHDLDTLIGEKQTFKVIKFDKKRGNIVLSRRVLLERERDARRKESLQNLQEGAVIAGTVKTITDYGAFIDLGGIDGLMHVTDMSWGRVNHPRELLKVGDELKVKVLKFDAAAGRISLGLKQIQEDPWTAAAAKYTPGVAVKGRVVSITDYGAFVELAPGVEGLMHVSEMSWTRVKHPSKVVGIGDEIETMVLDVDRAAKRISLGMKQLAANPWTLVAAKYPVGTVIKGKVRNITDFGIFVGIEDGIDGLVHIGDLTWTQRVKHPSELHSKGDDVEAMVLHVNAAEERVSLGIKQLQEDPRSKIAQTYPPGARIKGKVRKITDFGAFIEIEPGIEGLCHISEFDTARVEDPYQFLKIDQEVEVMVLDVDNERIALSIKALKEPTEPVEERTDYRAYLNSSDGRATLGDILKDKGRG